eukprot:scaffold13.g170.t1
MPPSGHRCITPTCRHSLATMQTAIGVSGFTAAAPVTARPRPTRRLGSGARASSVADGQQPAKDRRELLAAALGAAALGLAAPSRAACELTTAANGLAYCDEVVGEGEPPAAGALIRAHYRGKLASGVVFDSSYERGRPITFKIGVGQVIKGWDLGILGDGGDIPPMQPGGKRTLVIPPELGYGQRGAGGVIPPGATLEFSVELLPNRRSASRHGDKLAPLWLAPNRPVAGRRRVATTTRAVAMPHLDKHPAADTWRPLLQQPAPWEGWRLPLTAEQKDVLFRLMRVWNVVPSVLLVLVGAWLGAGKAMAAAAFAAHAGTVAFMAAASAGIALASCIVNDYFDARIDALNDASKPIPSGAVTPDGALLLASCMYVALLAGACLLPSPGLRLVIAASAAATLAYTPLLKRVLLLKNLTVAATVAAAPLAGALAVGAAPTAAGLAPVLLPSTYVFLMIWLREAMMDMSDAEGDAQAGVVTLPVAIGLPASLACCAALLAGAAAVCARVALRGGGLAWLCAAPAPAWAAPAARAVALAAAAGVLAPSLAGLERIWRSGFSKEALAQGADAARATTFGVLLLALLA